MAKPYSPEEMRVRFEKAKQGDYWLRVFSGGGRAFYGKVDKVYEETVDLVPCLVYEEFPAQCKKDSGFRLEDKLPVTTVLRDVSNVEPMTDRYIDDLILKKPEQKSAGFGVHTSK